MPPITRRAALAGAGGALVAAPAARAAAKPRRTKAQLLPDPASITVSDPADLTALQCASLLQARRLSSRELTAACQRRIGARNGGPPDLDGALDRINAWIRLYPDVAEDLAARADARLSQAGVRKAGRRAPLVCGIPLGLKDLYAVKGKPVTASSRVLEGNVAVADCTVWARLKHFGMVLLGHTHTHEFAFGTSTPQTGNPWDVTRTPGGSSGGSGAALASRMVPAATGSDTGGSLRFPASLNGVSSIKPTYGLVSAYGVIPLSWTLDHCGPMARGAADLSMLLAAMAGPDVGDPASLAPPAPGAYPLRARPGRTPLKGTRIGVITTDGLDPGIAAVEERFRRELEGLGATLVPVVLPPDETGLTVLAADADAFHRTWFPARAADYTPEVAALLTAVRGLNLSAHDYLTAQRTRARLVGAVHDLITSKELTALVQPAVSTETPTRAELAGVPIPLASFAAGPVSTWDNTGFPVVTTPAGLSPESRMPVGMQLIGAAHTEAALLQLALDHQAAHPYAADVPPGLPA